MNFYFNETPLIKSKVILNKDNSFKTVNNELWDFQISIEPYDVLLLNFNYELKQCTGIEGYLNFRKCKKKAISLKCAKTGVLKVNDFFVSKDAYGVVYKLGFRQCYFDDRSNIFAIGNIDSDAEILNFGFGQYVKIEEGQIIAIYIKF